MRRDTSVRAKSDGFGLRVAMRLHRPSELFWARVRVRVRVRVSAAVRLHRPSKELGVRVEGQSFRLVWNTVIAKSLPLSTVIGVLCALGSWVCSKKGIKL